MKKFINSLQKIGETSDKIFSQYYFSLIVTFALLIAINYIRVDYSLASRWSGWSIGEWVINYDLGFVRRGLSGEVVRLLSRVFRVEINWTVFIIQCVTYCVFLYLFLISLKNKKITFWYFLLCFTPGFLLFTYYDGMAVGRKEIILYVLYGIWINLNDKNKINNNNIICIAIALFFLTILHEAFFFYSLYFYFLYVLVRPTLSGGIKRVFVIPLASALAMVITFVQAKTIEGPLLCAELIKQGLHANVCEGSIGYGSLQPAAEIQSYLSNFNSQNLIDISLIIVIIFLPNLLFLVNIKDNKLKKYEFMLGSMMLIIFSFPLFIIAVDWGRWVAMHVTMLTMTLVIFLKNKNDNDNDNAVNNILYKNKVIFTAGAFMVFIAMTSAFSIQHCCGNEFVNMMGPVKKIANTLRLIN